MQRSGLMLGAAVLALAFSVAAPALGQDVDFGDDASTWANDGQCDDPRFEGPGAALMRSPVDEMHDATDCGAAFEAGEVTLVAADQPATANVSGAETDIDFGDDSGNWANDGECDDPRFGGTLDSHLRADATDCRTAYEAGDVTFAPQADAGAAVPVEGDFDFGDDSGSFANDGECDDPRFGGALSTHEMADATDCRTAYEAGEVTFTAPADTAVSDGEIDFGDDAGSFANDGECDDPRFGGALTSHEMADATDCRTAYEAGEVTYTPPAEPQPAVEAGDIDFGDDSGVWANDGECDDPRFGGSLDSHELADATDCRTAYEAGDVTYSPDGQDGGEPITIDGIEFGDDSGNWSNDGECDDPRFIGSGVGVALDDHLMADATDCSTAYEAGTVTLAPEDGDTGDVTINFGDDSGTYANDGECDDPRFSGTGVGVPLDDHRMADATDCRTAYEAGTVTLGSEGDSGDVTINFGDDSSAAANDGICDDPRFQGRGGASELLASNLMADATDCRAAYEAGTVTYNP